ncbi:unnamed protein product [Closterium sp. NIES-64]|nr:unnamed protein product [Closterium sp. NIES-64]
MVVLRHLSRDLMMSGSSFQIQRQLLLLVAAPPDSFRMAPVEPPPAGSVMTYEQLRQAKMQATQRAFAELQSLSADLTQETRRQAGENQQQKQPRRTWTRRKLFDKVRRSGRLQNSPATQYLELDDRTPELQNSPVTQYVELDDKTPERSTTRRTRAWQLRPMGSAGSAEAGTVVRCGKEVYTEEDLRKLRGHVKPYDISVERFKNRVYDPVNGKTCHQCRQKTLGLRTGQKTLGLRTECAACKDRSVCGQFCGDCLFVRYGENIEEALADPTWECPVCRDICNCSICRNRKGWGPTGPLFHKVWGAGYQSVAHYLMLTRMVKDGESTGARADGGVEGGSGSEEGGEAEGGSDGAGGESGENDKEGGCEVEGGQDGSEVTLIEECKDGNEKARKRKREVERSAVETRGRKQGLGRKKECVIMKGEEEDEKEKEEDDEDVVEIQVCRTVVQVKEEREEGEVEGVSEIEWTKMTAVEEEGVEEGETGGAAAGGGRAGMGKGVAAAVGDSKKGTKSGLKLVMRSAVKGMGKRGGREEVEEDKAQLRHLQKEEDSDSDDDVVEVVVARTV